MLNLLFDLLPPARPQHLASQGADRQGPPPPLLPLLLLPRHQAPAARPLLLACHWLGGPKHLVEGVALHLGLQARLGGGGGQGGPVQLEGGDQPGGQGVIWYRGAVRGSRSTR